MHRSALLKEDMQSVGMKKESARDRPRWWEMICCGDIKEKPKEEIPFPQVWKTKHPVFTNICERIIHSKVLIEFDCGASTGCQHCNKPLCEISSLLGIPQSTVISIFVGENI